MNAVNQAILASEFSKELLPIRIDEFLRKFLQDSFAGPKDYLNQMLMNGGPELVLLAYKHGADEVKKAMKSGHLHRENLNDERLEKLEEFMNYVDSLHEKPTFESLACQIIAVRSIICEVGVQKWNEEPVTPGADEAIEKYKEEIEKLIRQAKKEVEAIFKEKNLKGKQ